MKMKNKGKKEEEREQTATNRKRTKKKTVQKITKWTKIALWHLQFCCCGQTGSVNIGGSFAAEKPYR